MAWAGYASALQLLARLELLIGTAHLLAETAGIGGPGECRAGDGRTHLLCRHVRLHYSRGGSRLRANARRAFVLGDGAHLRALITMTSERIVNIFEHVATSSVVFTATAEDFDVPELRPLIDRYGRGKGVDAFYRHRLCRLAWELTADSFGGRQQLYERLHSGSPEVIVSNAYHRYDKTKGIAMVNADRRVTLRRDDHAGPRSIAQSRRASCPRSRPRPTRATISRGPPAGAQHDDYDLLVDVDAHLQEGGFWPEIIDLLGNDVLKQTAQAMMRPGALPLINMQPGMTFQALAGRVPHQSGPQEKTDDPAKAGHRFVQIVRRTIESMGLDYQVIFPTAMLHLGMNPMEEIEVELARAYARWLTERILPEDKRIIALLYLPFNSPLECEKLVREFGDRPGIVGFTVCAVRHKPVHHNQYARLYSMIEETGKPLVFHAGPHWDDPSFTQLNRFISMHALSFVHYNLIHMTNWIINAMPERYPED